MNVSVGKVRMRIASRNLPRPPAAINDGERVRLPDNIDMSSHGDQLLFHPADIFRNPQNPVRVMPGEVGFYERLGHNPGFVAGGTGGGKNLGADLFQGL